MIGILNIQDADIIDKLNSENLSLCLIPSGRIKLKKSEYEILKDLFLENIEVIDAPSEYITHDEVPTYFWEFIKSCIKNNKFPTQEELDSENYYLKSSLPTFLNKFIEMSLTEPAGIKAETYAQTCELLQAEPRLLEYNKIYNYPHRFIPISQQYLPSIGGAMYGIASTSTIQPSITPNGYYLPNNCILSTQQSNGDISDYLYVEALMRFTSKSNPQMIASWYNGNSSNDSLQGAYLSKTSGNAIMFWARRATVSGSSISLTSNINNFDISKDVGVTLINGQGDVTLKTMHYAENSDIPTYQTVTLTSDSNKTFPTVKCGIRIGGRIYKTGATVNSTITGAKYYKKFFYQNTEKNPVVNIYYPTSQTINEKLLMIV